MGKDKLHDFYNSRQWQICRQSIITARTEAAEDKRLHCAMCGKVLVDKGDVVLHHTPVELTEDNVADVMVSLNPENIAVVCKKCHNEAHGRTWNKKHFKRYDRCVYLVYGPPLSGKTTFVRDNMLRGDLVVDMDRLFQAVTLNGLYDKPDRLLTNVISVRDKLIEDIKYRKGGWLSAWIIGGYPQKSRREKLMADLGAEAVLMDVPRELCLERLASCGDYRSEHSDEYGEYINAWFDNHTA